MRSRERVLLALDHKEPDRVPIDFGGTGVTGASEEMTWRIRERLGLMEERDPDFPYFDDAVQRYFGVDFRRIPMKGLGTHVDESGRQVDEWGVVDYKDERDNPLRYIDRVDLGDYPWPDPYDPRRVEGLRKYAKHLYHHTEYALVGGHPYGHGLFEGGCRLRGYDQFLLDFAVNPDWVRAFFDIMLDLQLKFVDVYLGEIGEYIQAIWLGDDSCTQRGPYVSPKMYRELVKPYFRELIRGVKHKTDAKIMIHCCGACYDLLSDFIEMGIDILNPVQPEAAGMGQARLKEDYGDRLSFWGGIGMQQVLSRGTPGQVEAFVKETVHTLGRGGGYVLAAAHTLPDDIPPENVLALFETGKTCSYPLRR